MDMDQLIREYRNRSSSWQALVGVYAIILGGLVLSANVIL